MTLFYDRNADLFGFEPYLFVFLRKINNILSKIREI